MHLHWRASDSQSQAGNKPQTPNEKPLHLLFTECLMLQAGSACFRTGQRLEAVSVSLLFRWVRQEWQVSHVTLGTEVKLNQKIALKLLLSWKLHCLTLCISVAGKKKILLEGNRLSLQMCMYPYAPTSRIHHFLSEDQKVDLPVIQLIDRNVTFYWKKSPLHVRDMNDKCWWSWADCIGTV